MFGGVKTRDQRVESTFGKFEMMAWMHAGHYPPARREWKT